MATDILDGERVLAFDLETTGISTTSTDRVVQIALIGADEEGFAINYECIVNPRRPIPFGASNVHGIYDHEMSKEKVIFLPLLTRLLNWLKVRSSLDTMFENSI